MLFEDVFGLSVQTNLTLCILTYAMQSKTLIAMQWEFWADGNLNYK